MHFRIRLTGRETASTLHLAASQCIDHFLRANDEEERSFWSGLEAALAYASTLASQRLEIGLLTIADGCDPARAVVYAKRAMGAHTVSEVGSSGFVLWSAVVAGTMARLAASEGRSEIEKEASK